jgi:hypothetical protein
MLVKVLKTMLMESPLQNALTPYEYWFFRGLSGGGISQKLVSFEAIPRRFCGDVSDEYD